MGEDLIDCGMLGIDRQQLSAGPPDTLDQGRTAADQALLVGESEGRTGSRRGPGRAQPCGSDNGGHDPVRGPGCGLDHRLVAGSGLDPRPGQRLAQHVELRGICRDRQLRLPAPRLFSQPDDIGTTGQGLDLEHTGPGALGLIHQVERRTAD